jgi:hypothetical protein
MHVGVNYHYSNSKVYEWKREKFGFQDLFDEILNLWKKTTKDIIVGLKFYIYFNLFIIYIKLDFSYQSPLILRCVTWEVNCMLWFLGFLFFYYYPPTCLCSLIWILVNEIIIFPFLSIFIFLSFFFLTIFLNYFIYLF